MNIKPLSPMELLSSRVWQLPAGEVAACPRGVELQPDRWYCVPFRWRLNTVCIVLWSFHRIFSIGEQMCAMVAACLSLASSAQSSGRVIARQYQNETLRVFHPLTQSSGLVKVTRARGLVGSYGGGPRSLRWTSLPINPAWLSVAESDDLPLHTTAPMRGAWAY